LRGSQPSSRYSLAAQYRSLGAVNPPPLPRSNVSLLFGCAALEPEVFCANCALVRADFQESATLTSEHNEIAGLVFGPAYRREGRVAGLSVIADLQREVDMRLREGAPFAQIEHDVIEPSALSEEDKSALWLYGWASRDERPSRGPQHREAFLR
jgi:hypothetical protein